MKEQFDQFLKKHRAWRKYYKLFDADKNRLWTMEQWFENSEPHDYIASAFQWPHSEVLFWAKLSDKWKKLVNIHS